MNIRRILNRKIWNNTGSSLVEMLATVLLMGIMGVALVVGVATVQNTHGKIVRKANEQTLLSTTLIEMRNAIRKSVDSKVLRTDGIVTVYFKSRDGYWFSFVNPNDSTGEKGIQIKYYYLNENGVFTSQGDPISVVAKSNGNISGIYSRFDGIESISAGTFKIKNLTVGNDNPILLSKL